MENLRWILIITGVAILVLLYFSGRPRQQTGRPVRRPVQDSGSEMDMNMSSGGRSRGDDVDPLLRDEMLGDQYPVFNGKEADDFARPGSISDGPAIDPTRVPAPDYQYEFDDLNDKSSAVSSGFSSLSQKFEAFSELLSPKRRKLIAQSEPADLDEQSAGDPKYAHKIITLHVVAPPETVLAGDHLLAVFERRGYHFGDMNIFHSMHEGTTVYSIAKMIEPGFFDIDDLDSFETPGITLILQLPGPVPADVAFEVMVNEAYEMASELGARVLDEQHSTLTKQTVQHLRDEVYEYMHRQKYFGTLQS